jgi:CspA family cold shock protein
VNTRDRDFRAPRPRGLDDDGYQPPGRNFGYAPPRGPQFDTPTGPTVQATVKWYNPDKGFGFVTLADGSGDAFLHVSVLERAGATSVPPGATLDIRSGPGPKGQQVTEVMNVDVSTASQEPPRRARMERPTDAGGDRATVEELGTVKWYNGTKGFGFIVSDRGGKDIFVHASVLERGGIGALAERDRASRLTWPMATRDERL